MPKVSKQGRDDIIVKVNLLITYLVCSENYHVYLLITRDKSEWRIHHTLLRVW